MGPLFDAWREIALTRGSFLRPTVVGLRSLIHPTRLIPHLGLAPTLAIVSLEHSVLESKSFYRRMEALLESIPVDASPRRFADQLVDRLTDALGDGTALHAVQLYSRRAKGLRLSNPSAAAPDLADELTRRLGTGEPDAIAELPWSGETAAGPTGLFLVPDETPLVVALHFDRQRDGNPSSRRSTTL